jgi:asparagine synthase (glutamine-hydrolysing)
MCGIVAIYAPTGRVEPDSLTRATARLHHRGPDAQRQWIAPHGRVGLGHARLSIIDLVTGDQPIANEDGQRHIIVNGELYDFARIRRELELGGHRFRTGSDSEIALHLYEDMGPACLERLRGEYALVLWDESRQQLFAARDRFGIKPLYFAWHRGALYLASEVKALFAAGVPARWSHEGLFDAAVMGMPPSATLFEGVSQVPPGHYLLVGPGGARLCPYWDFSYPEAADPAPARTDADWADELRATLDEAVRLRLRADVPVGCYLSGGLDSCAVIGLAARHLSTPIRAFTLAFDLAAYDETPIAREMAQRANAEFYPIPIRQVDLAEHFADAAWNAESLFLNAHGVAKYVLSRAVRDAGYKVVLTGEGSDEILAGYPHFRRDMLLYDNGGQDPGAVQSLLTELEQGNAVSRGLLLPDGASAPLDAVRNALGFVPSWMEAAGGRLHKMQALWTDDTRTKVAGRAAYSGLLDGLEIRDRLGGRAPVNQALYLWAKAVLPNYILTVLGDRMEMAHSVEGRVPFLDHEVVELISRMPVHLKIRGMTEKYVLREAARPVLTDTVYRRQKHPFLTPPATLNPHDRLHQMVQDTLRGPRLDHMPLVERHEVVRLLDGLDGLEPEAQVAIDQILMMLLSGCVLGERLGLTA